MASNRIVKPLRVVRLSPSCPDKAVDWQKSNIAEYIQTRDSAHLSFVEGDDAPQPVWFVVKRLPQAFLSGILDAITVPAHRRVTAFLAAVHHVETGPSDAPVVYKDPDTDEALNVWPPGVAPKGAPWASEERSYGVHMAPESWAQEIADVFGAEVVQELGQVAIDFARLPRGARGPFGSWLGSVASG